MSFLSNIFQKPSDMETMKFNYHVNFEVLPSVVAKFNDRTIRYQNIIQFEKYLDSSKSPKSLVKKISVVDNGVQGLPNVKLIAIRVPNTGKPGQVAASLIAVDTKSSRAEYFTMEFSFGGYMICEPTVDEHINSGVTVANIEEFVQESLRLTLEYWKQDNESSSSAHSSEPQPKPVEQAQTQEPLSEYFPHHLDSEKFQNIRRIGGGAEAIVATLNFFVSQMAGRYPEWNGLFTSRVNKNLVEVTCLKGFEDNITRKAIPYLWKRKSFIENCMLLGVKKIVFLANIAQTFDLLDVDSINPNNYQ